jgi:two-component system, OmpR family, sensor histidine kinase BaeS
MPDVRRSLRTRLLASFFIAIALPLAVLGVYAVRALESATLDHLLINLTATARLAAAEAAVEPPGAPRRERMSRWARVLGVRIALVDLRGKTVAASGPLPPGIPAEPGVGAALRGRIARGQISGDSGERWLYAAAPVERGDSVGEVVDLLLPLRSVQGVFLRVRWALAAAFALAAILAGGLVLYLTQALFGPIAAMKAVAEQIGSGDLRERMPERPDELGDLARVLNAMARQLNERESARRDFLANVSHELRTPAANMQFTAQALLAGAGDDPGQRRRMLETIARESDRLTRLVQQLLHLLSLQSGRLALARESVQVPALLEDAAARFAARAASSGVRLDASPAPALPPLPGDPDRLAEVLDNLIDNALRSTPRGGTITLTGRAEDGVIVLEVADTGRGISEADLPFVFEKFYRGDTARDRGSGGTGLGLSIVKAIVEAHGGRISAESGAGGTRFVIRLPSPGDLSQPAPASPPVQSRV